MKSAHKHHLAGKKSNSKLFIWNEKRRYKVNL